MILPSIAFVLCGSFLFGTPMARHLISQEQPQTSRDSTGSLPPFAHVEGRPQGVKSFPSKQFETTSERVHGDEISTTRDENDEKNSWEYTGAESDPYEKDSGSAEDLHEVEEPSDSNNVENVQDDKTRGKENEIEQSGKTAYTKNKRLSATKLEDNNNDDGTKLGAGSSFIPGKDLVDDDAAQEDNSYNSQRLMDDSRIRRWVKESAGNINQTNVQNGGLSSHINGLINNSYVTHVVESTGDKEQTEDEEEGGDLSSRRFDKSNNTESNNTESNNTESNNTDNLVKPTYDKEQAEDEEGDSSIRNLDTNAKTDILESTSRDTNQADLENDKESDYTNVVTNTLEDKDQAAQEEEKGIHSKAKNQEDLEDEEGSGWNNRNLNANVATNVLEDQAKQEEKGSHSKAKGQADLEYEDGSHSSSRNLNTNVTTNTLEDKNRAAQEEERGSHSKAKNQADLQDEEVSDSNNWNLNTSVVTNIPESGERDQTDMEEERRNPNNATLNNNTVAQILESSRVAKDPANSDEDRSDSNGKKHREHAPKDIAKPTDDEAQNEKHSNSKYPDDNTAAHIVKATQDKDQSGVEKFASESENLHDSAPKDTVKSDDDKAQESEKDSLGKYPDDTTAAHIVKATQDKDQSEDKNLDSESENLHDSAPKDTVKPVDDKAQESEKDSGKYPDDTTAAHIVKATQDKDQAEDKNLVSESENLPDSGPKDTVKPVDDTAQESEKDSLGKYPDDTTVAHIVKATQDKDQAEDKNLDSESENLHDSAPKDTVKPVDDKAQGSEKDSGKYPDDTTAAHIVEATQDKDHTEDKKLDSESENLHDSAPKDTVKSDDDEAQESEKDSGKYPDNTTAAHIVKSTQDKDQAEDKNLYSESENLHDSAPKDTVKSDDVKAQESEEDSGKYPDNTTAAHIVKSTQDKDQAEDKNLYSESENLHDSAPKDTVKQVDDKAQESEEDSSKLYPDGNTAAHIVKSTRGKGQAGNKGLNSKSKKLHSAPEEVTKAVDDKALENKEDSSIKYDDDNTADHTVKLTENKDQAEDEEERNQSAQEEKLHDNTPNGPHDEALENEEDSSSTYHDKKTAAHIVKSTGNNGKDKEDDDEEKDKNMKLNNDAVMPDLERTGKAQDHMANDVRKQEDMNPKSTPSVSHASETPEGKDHHYKEEEHSARSQNTLEASGDSYQAEFSEEDLDDSKNSVEREFSKKKKMNDNEKEKENKDITQSDEYDKFEPLSSGEQTFADGNQLELASLISSKPGKEGRVARTKIYKPEIQSDHGDQDDEDIQGVDGTESSTKAFDDYVADDVEQEDLHLEDEEEENAMGRDWVEGDEPGSTSARKVKDWEAGKKSGAKERGGLQNDYKKHDGRNEKKTQNRKGKAAHKNVEQSPKTQAILASLENEMYHGGAKQTNSKKHIQKAHRKLKLHKSRVVHKPHGHEETSKFSSSVIVYPPKPPLIMSPVMPAPTDMTLTIKFTYHQLNDAQQKGAVCIDGTTPSYYFRKGFGNGVSNWIIYLQGGAWCESKEACLERSTTPLGSSRYFQDVQNPGGLLSGDYKDNPTFFNWNVVYLPYCDGSSFAGNRSEPVEVEGEMLYFRGKRILSAAMDDLLRNGMQQAQDVVLSGTSAGGLAVMLHNDFVRSRLPSHVHLHSLADSGFFLDIPTREGQVKFRKDMQNVFKLHDCTSGVNQKCISSMSAKDLWKCIFPQYFLPYVESPLYLVNPIFDSWQLENVYDLHCTNHIDKCTKKEKEEIDKFGEKAMDALTGAVHRSPAVQMYADACVDHGQVINSRKWNTIKVKNMSINGAFTKWYRNASKKALANSVVDSTKFLDNPTCV